MEDAERNEAGHDILPVVHRGFVVYRLVVDQQTPEKAESKPAQGGGIDNGCQTPHHLP